MRPFPPLVAASLASLVLAAPAPAAAASKGAWWETRTEVPGFPGAPAHVEVEKECLPPDLDALPQTDADDDCKISGLKRSGAKTTWKMECEGGHRGEGELVRSGDTFTVKTVVRGPMGEVRFTTRGKKLGGTCDPDEEDARAEALEQYERQGLHGEAEICARAVEGIEPGPFLGPPVICKDPGQKAALCKAAGADEVVRALLEPDNAPQRAQLAKLCGLDAERHRARLCADAAKLARDGDAFFFAESCRKEADPVAKRECAGRAYTAVPKKYRDFCAAWAGVVAQQEGGGAEEGEDADEEAPPPPRKRKASRDR
jgi:hypothetical protein